jgi:hypothetical protein
MTSNYEIKLLRQFKNASLTTQQIYYENLYSGIKNNLSKSGKILGTPYLSMAVKEASGLEAKTVKINGTNLSLDAGSLLESMSVKCRVKVHHD